MISKSTAAAIYTAYCEIEKGEALLRDIEAKATTRPSIIDDPFGRHGNFQLGVPNGNSGHQLFAVRPELAKSVIRAHIADKQRELVEANEAARIQLDTAELDPVDA